MGIPVRCEICETRSTTKLLPLRRCDALLEGTGTKRNKVVSGTALTKA